MTNYNITMFTDKHTGPPEKLTKQLGGKGANLHRMATELELPVPEGFTIPCVWTSACKDHDNNLSGSLKAVVDEAVLKLNTAAGIEFGDAKNPLLVSVRSGAPKSMPGMMETILNLGLNDKTVVGLAKLTDETFAWDSYRRFIQMYAVTALGMDPKPFNEHLETCKAFANSEHLDVDMLKLVVKQFKEIVKTDGKVVPQDVNEQLYGAILAVFNSWWAPKAKAYRKIENISPAMGTAVNVQRMVFGNRNDQSGTGVVFTRDPNTGHNTLYGDFLINAQGEDVVDGSHITMPISAMNEHFPEQFTQLTETLALLEKTFGDMCDVEFTIEDGKLFILQTRIGKRNSAAAVRIAIDMLTESKIDKETCIERIEELKSAPQALHDSATFNGTLAATGLGAAPGTVVGAIVFTSDDAVTEAAAGKEVILVTQETNPSDIEGMAASVGILTATGGLVSHAAVVARGWNKPCVVGCSALAVSGTSAAINGKVLNKGDLICINGATGEVFMGV